MIQGKYPHTEMRIIIFILRKSGMICRIIDGMSGGYILKAPWIKAFNLSACCLSLKDGGSGIQ
jgi:hypothetical protein